jgi:hypothetical protein
MILTFKKTELWTIVTNVKKMFTLNSKMIDSNVIKLKQNVIFNYYFLNEKTIDKIVDWLRRIEYSSRVE